MTTPFNVNADTFIEGDFGSVGGDAVTGQGGFAVTNPGGGGSTTQTNTGTTSTIVTVLSVGASAGGTVTPDGQSEGIAGRRVTITANPLPGYQFAGWEINKAPPPAPPPPSPVPSPSPTPIPQQSEGGSGGSQQCVTDDDCVYGDIPAGYTIRCRFGQCVGSRART